MTDLIAAKETARIDYVSVVDADTLQSLDLLQERVLIALAVWFGKARLIDNTIVTC